MTPVEQPDDDSPWSRGSRAVGEGLLLTLLQIAFACIVGLYHDGRFDASPDRLLQSYFNLVQYDGHWYWCIAQEGYHVDREFQPGKIGNVAFFPGYPLLVQGVHFATGWPWRLCLLLVSQMACWGFWTYLLLLLSRYEVPVGRARLTVVFIAAQPAAFFLIASYSESLFLFSLLGFIYWSDSESPALKWLGALHGILMTATRIVGLPLVIYPVLRSLTRSSGEFGIERVFGGLILAAVSSLGGIAFFAYCHEYAGSWNAYMIAQERGWKIVPNYLALVELDTYLLDLTLWQIDGFLSPDWLSRAVVPVFVGVFLLLALAELWIATQSPSSSFEDRVGLFVLAFAMFFVATAGLHAIEYHSMIRYVFCSVVLLSLHIAHLLNNEDIDAELVMTGFAWLIIVPSFVVQAVFLHRFLNGQWVA